MTPIFKGRYRADIEGDFVVFLIGMRPNRIWKVKSWRWVAMAMVDMLKVLEAHKEKGLLGYRQAITLDGPLLIQYWRSLDDLFRFAESAEDPHLGPWRRFNKEAKDSADVGIWHETYQVKAGAYKTVYVHMPRLGLAAAAEHVPASHKGRSAAKRAGAAPAGEDAAAEEHGDG